MMNDWQTSEINSINQYFGIINSANPYLSSNTIHKSNIPIGMISSGVTISMPKDIQLINKYKLLQLI